MLQSTTLDLAKAADLVSGTIETLADLRTDTYWNRLFTYVESVAKLHSIDIIGNRLSRKRELPSHLCDADTVLLESTGSCEALTTSQQFKVGLYYPVLRRHFLDRRFSGRNLELMKAIYACSPQCSQFLKPE